MLIYYCWLDVSGCKDEPELDRIHDHVRGWREAAHFEDLRSDGGLRLGVVDLNGSPMILGYGCRNHHVSEGNDILDLMSRLTELAPDSCGILYLQDDEDSCLDRRLVWREYLLQNGSIVECEDPYFSPMIPTVEE